MLRGNHFRQAFCSRNHFRQLTRMGLRHGASEWVLLANTHKRYKVDLPYRHRISVNLTVANLDIEALSIIKISKSSSPKLPVFITHQLCPPYLRQLIKDTVKSFDDK